MGDLREPDGGAAAGEERPSPSPSPSTSISSNSSPTSIGLESWGRAEKTIQKIIFKVQPTTVSEGRRKEVIDYVQGLIRTCLGCEVFPYGSVPLKTYLPDGDIDLTAFGGVSSEDVLAKDIVSVLEGEDQTKAAEFIVKDVQLIQAEVKLVKCIVQNIVVDISFNQIGGLCTLCFLEQVDRFIGKEHLFKRSIILIKAWCYYESRILGAHHGLISTYALETLVLYIFHLFHSSLNGPLAVLYKFLDYFSKFDWENYCISLSGPVCLSSLPEFVVEKPDNGGGDLLLTSEFLRFCIDMFSVPSRGIDLNSRTFQPKYLNIVDPLKENNNLGRSVSKGNFYRIRSAFTYGARKLGQILMEPVDDIDEGLCKFFSNMLDRHGSGQRPDVQSPLHVRSYNGFGPALVVSKTESCPVGAVIPETESMSCVGTMEECRSNPNGSSHNAISDMKAAAGENKYRNNNDEQESAVEVLPSTILAEAGQTTMGKALADRIFGDAKDLATSRFESLKISNGFPKYPEPIAEESAAPMGTPYHAPHLHFSNSMLSNGDMGNNNLDTIQIENCEKNRYFGVSRGSDLDNGVGLVKHIIAAEDDVLVSAGFKDVHLATNKVSYPENSHHISWDSASATAGTPESWIPMSDLSGDYDSHFNYLQYGRFCSDYASGMAALPMNVPPPSLFQMMNLWDGAQQSSQLKWNGFSHASVNGVVSSPAFYTVNPVLIPGMAFGLEEMPKPRGTGTYLPNLNRPLQGYRPSLAKGRNQASSRSPHKNVRNRMFMENNGPDHRSDKLSQSPVSADQSSSKPGTSDINLSFFPSGEVHPSANALVLQSHGGFEFSSAGHVAEAPPLERRKQRQQRTLTSSTQNSSPVSPSGMQRSKAVLSRDYDRLSMKSSYHLKDDDDFPPLSL